MNFVKFLTQYNSCPFCDSQLKTFILNYKFTPLEFKINENNILQIYDTNTTNNIDLFHKICDENKLVEIDLNSDPNKPTLSKFIRRFQEIRIKKTCLKKCLLNRNFNILSKSYIIKRHSQTLHSNNKAFFAIDFSFYDDYKLLIKYYPNWKKCFISNSRQAYLNLKNNKFKYFNYCGKIDANLYISKIENYLII